MDNQTERDKIDWLAEENLFRATPLDLLRYGILNKRWEAITQCYLMLTGNRIYPPSEAQLVERLKDVPAPEPVRPTIPIFEEPIRVDPSKETEVVQTVKRKRGRPKKVKPVVDTYANCVAPAKTTNGKLYTRASEHDCKLKRINKFVDDREIAKDEIVKNRKVPDEIIQAQRPPIKEVDIRCSGCGKKDKVEPGLVPYGLRLTRRYTMAYKCNDCIVGNRPSVELEEIGDESLYED